MTGWFWAQTANLHIYNQPFSLPIMRDSVFAMLQGELVIAWLIESARIESTCLAVIACFW